MKKKTRYALLISFLTFAALLFLEYSIPSFSLVIERFFGAPVRSRLSAVSSYFSFSLAEWLLLLLPIVLVLFLLFALRAAKSAKATSRLVGALLSFLLAFFAVYTLVFAPGQHRPPLADSLSLPDKAPTADEVLICVDWLSSLADANASYPGDAATEARLRIALAEAGKTYGFSANTAVSVKKNATPLFSRLGYFGLYAFPLGEITLTSACPDATRTFTLAHEMAHASGFSREADADVMAFLACLDSGDAYLVGAAATGMLGRVLCTLYEHSPALWERASGRMPDAARQELSDAGEVYERGTADALAPIAEDYGEVLRLLCAICRARAIT